MEEEENKRLGELLMELATGNAEALQGISLIMERILYGIGLEYLKNRADIEDSIHNLYLRLYKRAKKFQENVNAKAWVARMYENLLRTEKGNLKREKEFLSEYEQAQARAAGADEKYIINYLFLREMFSRLSHNERRTFMYYHWCGCTLREVAKIMHKSKTAVEYQLNKIKEKIEKE